jgi:hypothetical protein
MSFAELEGERWILSVAQKSFQAGGNDFSTLAPLVSEDGRRAKPDLFPNSGLVWWMLLGFPTWAQPGRLVVASLDPSPVFQPGDPTKHLYQAHAEGVKPVSSRDAVEVLTVSTAVKRPEELVDRTGILRLDHYPTETVWVRLGANVFGPFKPSVTVVTDSQIDVVVSLPPHSPVVRRVADSALAKLSRGYYKSIAVEVSRSSSARYVTTPTTITYELLVGDAIDQLVQLGEEITLESDDRVIARAAKQVLPRKKQQELRTLLTELESVVTSSAEASDAATVIMAVQRRLQTNSTAVEELVDRILQTGVLDKKFDQRLTTSIEAEVKRQASYLMAEAEQQSAEVQRRLRASQVELGQVEEELTRKRKDAEVGLANEMEARRAEVERTWQEREAALTERESHVEERQGRLRTALEDAARRLQEQRDVVVTDVLTILPLLSAIAPPLPAASASGDVRAPAEPTPGERSVLELPAFIRTERSAEYRTPLREDEFFERFTRHVRNKGFAYEPDDLLAMHLSVKTSDLTLLSGVSGTGKSSLPRFYMEALQGSESTELDGDIGRYLHVAVRPSWLDQEDLLGHVNTLDHEFVPSESGLFPLLAAAADEFRRRGPDSGLYLVCLDEMNLAQVEHYFGSFLSALERPSNERRIRCFDPASVSAGSPFRVWSQLPLPDTLHFVGTVNIDETTRPLSLRFLDRADTIELATQDFHTLRTAASAAKQDPVDVPGRPITLRDMRSWNRDEPLAPDLASVLDTIRDPLRKMRRPLTPRRYQALTRFVASAAGLPDICSAEKAFDLQLSLRMVPQLRSLSSPEAREGLTDLVRDFESHGYHVRLPRTWEALQDVVWTLQPFLEIG